MMVLEDKEEVKDSGDNESLASASNSRGSTAIANDRTQENVHRID
jgi:hypothetical protein